MLLFRYVGKIQRTTDVIFGRFSSRSQARGFEGSISDCYINVTSKIDDPFLPNLGMDQSYGLSVSASGIEITAATAIGRSSIEVPFSKSFEHTSHTIPAGNFQSQVLCMLSRAFLNLYTEITALKP